MLNYLDPGLTSGAVVGRTGGGVADTWTAENATMSAYDGNLIGVYLAEEASGNLLDDTSTVNGVLNGTVNSDASGKNNKARAYVGGYFNRPTATYDDSAQIATKAFSISTWFKTSTTGSSIFMWGNSEGVGGLYCYQRADNDHIQVYTSTAVGGLAGVQSSGTYNDGAWHHLLTTMSSTQLELSIDGSSIGTADLSAFTVGDLNYDFLIGRSYNSTAWSGSLDETYLFDTEVAEATALYNSGTGAFRIAQ